MRPPWMGSGSAVELSASPLVGALWETFVCGELRQALARAGSTRHLHFWRERTKEAEFLIQAGGRFALADAAWTELPAPADASRRLRICDELPRGRVERVAVICRTERRHPLIPAATPPVEALGPGDPAGFAIA